MAIASFDIELLNVGLSKAIATRQSVITTKSVIIFKIQEAGLIGYGEAAPVPSFGCSIESTMRDLTSFFASSSGRSVDLLWERIQSEADSFLHVNPFARNAVVSAVLDLLSKRESISIYEYLGLACPEGVRGACSLFMGESMTSMHPKMRGALESAEDAIIKFKPTGSFKDREILLEAHRAISCRVWLDCDGLFATYDQFAGWLDMLPPLNYLGVEDPLQGDVGEGYRKCNALLPVYCDRKFVSPGQMDQLQEYVSGFVIKPSRLGGIDIALDCIDRCKQHQKSSLLSCVTETGLGISSDFQVAGGYDWVDLDGNLVFDQDPFSGPTWQAGRLHSQRPSYGHGSSPHQGES